MTRRGWPRSSCSIRAMRSRCHAWRALSTRRELRCAISASVICNSCWSFPVARAAAIGRVFSPPLRSGGVLTRGQMRSLLHPSLFATGLALLIAAAAALAPTPARAHAIVLKTSLGEHPIKPGAADSITLHFNSRIEVKLSRAVLVSRDRPERALQLVAGKAPGEVLVQLPALEAGSYALRYRVLAADGHVTEDTIRFSVSP